MSGLGRILLSRLDDLLLQSAEPNLLCSYSQNPTLPNSGGFIFVNKPWILTKTWLTSLLGLSALNRSSLVNAGAALLIALSD